MTINPARLLQHENKTGSIEVGKAADLVVLDKNIFEIPVEEIHTVQVLMTMFQGEAVYDPEGMLGETIGSVPTSGVFGLSVLLIMSIGQLLLLATLF